jgi:KUP system potassium uptake protein
MAALALGALGVVHGDIGTSPLYALQTVFTVDNHAVHPDPDSVYGVISLVQNVVLRRRMAKAALVALGIFGASLFYGDGMITPAISVLSAVEGLKVVSPDLHSLVVPITVAIIAVLFAIQRLGTGAVGRLFGPVMAVWFVVLAVAGVKGIADHPGILRAVSPTY